MHEGKYYLLLAIRNDYIQTYALNVDCRYPIDRTQSVATLLMTSTTVEVDFDASIDEVWSVYTDFESQASWRADVEMASIKICWTKTTNYSTPMTILEKVPQSRLTVTYSGRGIFEGGYVAEYKTEQSGTVGISTEESTSLGTIPEIMSRLFVNQEDLIVTYANETKAEILTQINAPIPYGFLYSNW